MKPTSKLKLMVLGDLPCAALATWGLTLDAGTVHFGIPAQRHALRRHPDSYPDCVPHLEAVVATPTHVGQSPHHEEDGFELVRVVDGGPIVLLAIKMERTESGIYIATSTYPIDVNTLERRIRKGHVVAV